MTPPLPRDLRNARLRRLRDDDLDAFLACRADPELGRYQGWSALSRAQAAAFIAEMQEIPLFPPGEWFQLAIADPATDRLAGDVGLHFDPAASQVELGFTVCRAAHGRGIATAAAEAALALCWQATPARAVVGITDVRNAPSIRVLEKLGMRPVERRAAVVKGEPCEELVFRRDR